MRTRAPLSKVGRERLIRQLAVARPGSKLKLAFGPGKPKAALFVVLHLATEPEALWIMDSATSDLVGLIAGRNDWGKEPREVCVTPTRHFVPEGVLEDEELARLIETACVIE